MRIVLLLAILISGCATQPQPKNYIIDVGIDRSDSIFETTEITKDKTIIITFKNISTCVVSIKIPDAVNIKSLTQIIRDKRAKCLNQLINKGIPYSYPQSHMNPKFLINL